MNPCFPCGGADNTQLTVLPTENPYFVKSGKICDLVGESICRNRFDWSLCAGINDNHAVAIRICCEYKFASDRGCSSPTTRCLVARTVGAKDLIRARDFEVMS